MPGRVQATFRPTPTQIPTRSWSPTQIPSRSWSPTRSWCPTRSWSPTPCRSWFPSWPGMWRAMRELWPKAKLLQTATGGSVSRSPPSRECESRRSPVCPWWPARHRSTCDWVPSPAPRTRWWGREPTGRSGATPRPRPGTPHPEPSRRAGSSLHRRRRFREGPTCSPGWEGSRAGAALSVHPCPGAGAEPGRPGPSASSCVDGLVGQDPTGCLTSRRWRDGSVPPGVQRSRVAVPFGSGPSWADGGHGPTHESPDASWSVRFVTGDLSKRRVPIPRSATTCLNEHKTACASPKRQLESADDPRERGGTGGSRPSTNRRDLVGRVLGSGR